MPAILSITLALLLPAASPAAVGFDPALAGAGLAAEKTFLTENSLRRNPRSRSEVANIVRVTGIVNCTGFLVANTLGRTYVATARHCARFELEKACVSGALHLRSAFNGAEGRCRRVVAGSAFDDLQVLEVEFPGGAPAAGYRLAKYLPRVGHELEAFGYPEDPARGGALTVTENCWDFSSNRAKPRYGLAFGIESAAGPVWSDMAPPGSPGGLQRLFQWHNCSVYGGNSGGPLVLAGTDEVMGIPATYQSDASRRYEATDVMPYETTAGFVKRNAAAVRAAGIVLSLDPGVAPVTH